MNAMYYAYLHAILRSVGTGILLVASMLFAGCRPHGITAPAPRPIPFIVTTTAVTTYHYDNLRSGWNSNETALNYSNVSNSTLRVMVIKLDDVNDQVDTQPLIVPNLQIAGTTHDVVYVTTEADNVYAFDANTGARLRLVNLGLPVPRPQGCTMNGPTVGVSGTPAIDLASSTMYVITYNLDSSKIPAYFIHALDLATLTDKVPPRQIIASQTLNDGKTTFKFNAAWERQRPGLVLVNGNVYAGFGGFCDAGGDQARGWLLGWKAGSLTPLPANLLTNTLTSEPNRVFLSGVWMSGYGIAGDQNGNIYFSTGNSDPSGGTYNENNNISDSVVRLNSNLTRPTPTSKFLFTPGNVKVLDQNDLDMSAGGVMLLPPQSGLPDMAVATGKDGQMFLLNRDNLGGHTGTDTGKLDVATIGNRCWCGPTYFSDGSPHIVSSGGVSPTNTVGPNPGISHNSVILWNLWTSPTPKLTQVASGNMPDTIQDPGFFTTVSSNGNNNAIIWAVARPQPGDQSLRIWLYAFTATPSGNTLVPLFQSAAGSWPYTQGNANIVPVVANGKVYVASYRELDIFRLGFAGAQGAQNEKGRAKALAQVQGPQSVKGPEKHQVWGIVSKVDGSHLTIETRDNKTLEVDSTEAKRLLRYAASIGVGSSVVAAGSKDENGVMHVVFVWRAKSAKASWPPDW